MNANYTKGNPASNMKIVTHTSDGKKRMVTDTRNGYLQQKILSNRNLPIVITTMDPRIDDRITTCSGTPHKLTTPTMKEVITDATRIRTRGFSGLLGM